MKFGTIIVLFLCFFATSLVATEAKIYISGDINGKPRFVSIKEIESISLSANGSLKTAHTITIDKKNKTDFEGVPLNEIIKQYGIDGVRKITVKAWDRYRITLDLDEIKKFSLLLATRENGKHIPYKERGPARIVTPQIQSDTEQLKEKVQIFAIREIIFIR